MNKADDYVLGTRMDEIARLGLQHRVWRPHVLDAWMRAGMTTGSKVADFGAGPGYASLDAAEIVGAGGEVVALERSVNFSSFARSEIERRGVRNVRLVERDVVEGPWELSGIDVAWCRWVASFVTHPAKLVQNIAASLRIGGNAVFHEYQDYGTWRAIPRCPPLESFVEEVMMSWRAAGGEPNIAPSLIPLLAAHGLRLVETRPLVFAVHPSDFMWQWPAAFVQSNSQRLVELGRVSQHWADILQREFKTLAANPDAILVTPMVMEIIAQKVSD